MKEEEMPKIEKYWGHSGYVCDYTRLAQLKWIRDELENLTTTYLESRVMSEVLRLIKTIDKELVSDSQVNRLPSTPSNGSVQEGEK